MGSTYKPSLAESALQARPRGEYTTDLADALQTARATVNEHLVIVGPEHPSTKKARQDLRELLDDARALFSHRHN